MRAIMLSGIPGPESLISSRTRLSAVCCVLTRIVPPLFLRFDSLVGAFPIKLINTC